MTRPPTPRYVPCLRELDGLRRYTRNPDEVLSGVVAEARALPLPAPSFKTLVMYAIMREQGPIYIVLDRHGIIGAAPYAHYCTGALELDCYFPGVTRAYCFEDLPHTHPLVEEAARARFERDNAIRAISAAARKELDANTKGRRHAKAQQRESAAKRAQDLLGDL